MRMKLKLSGDEPRQFAGTARAKMFDTYIGELLEKYPVHDSPIEWEEFARSLSILAKTIERAAMAAAIKRKKSDDSN